jgi:hypothetical protein
MPHNQIVEVYGNMRCGDRRAALVKTRDGCAFYVFPEEVNGVMPRVGKLLDQSKHMERAKS